MCNYITHIFPSQCAFITSNHFDISVLIYNRFYDNNNGHHKYGK